MAKGLKRGASRTAGQRTPVFEGSGNVFKDLGLPAPREHLLKAQLVRGIAARMKELALNQAATAVRIGITQREVSKMLRGHFRQLSIEQLLNFLSALGAEVDIRISYPTTSRSKVRTPITISAE